MSSSLKLISVLAALVFVVAACAGGGGATTRPSVASVAPSTVAPVTAAPVTTAPQTSAPATAAPATDEPTDEPTEEPSEAPSEAPSDGPAETASPEVTPSPSPPPAAQEGTLTLWVDETRFPILTDIGEQFTADTQVPVAVYQVGFGDIRDRLQLYGPAGEGPDVIIGAHDWLGQLATNGLVEPLDLGDAGANVDPVALDAFTYEGTLYGLPYASEALALYYNPTLVETPPTTWEELITMATALQTDQGLEQAFVIPERDPYHTYPMLTANGGNIFGRAEDGSYDPTQVGLDSDGGLAYGQMLSDMIDQGVLRPSVNYDTMMQLFTTGEAAMIMTGPWALSQIRESGVDYAVAPIPNASETARPFVGVQGFMVSADAPNKTTAIEFLRTYIATDEAMGALFTADPRPSTWTPLASTIDDPDVAAFIESASNGDPLPAIPEMSAVWTDWTDALDLIFTGAQESDAALTDAATSIRAIIAGGQ
jgi:maltose/maltodextrin transport system substrate-binding protein/arabinogalactan oligomer/maltooligosaccharide transport system substrate-binding protein